MFDLPAISHEEWLKMTGGTGKMTLEFTPILELRELADRFREAARISIDSAIAETLEAAIGK